MTVCTPSTPRSMTYSWLANVASCDAHTFFNNVIGFCSFDQDPQVQQPLQLITNCYKTILASEKKTNITIVSNKIQKNATNTNTKRKYYHCMSNMMNINVCLIRCRSLFSFWQVHWIAQVVLNGKNRVSNSRGTCVIW